MVKKRQETRRVAYAVPRIPGSNQAMATPDDLRDTDVVLARRAPAA
ncbi:MAG: hypothetical protein ACRDN0_09355 [Trebonia sp.]